MSKVTTEIHRQVHLPDQKVFLSVEPGSSAKEEVIIRAGEGFSQAYFGPVFMRIPKSFAEQLANALLDCASEV